MIHVYLKRMSILLELGGVLYKWWQFRLNGQEGLFRDSHS